MSAGYGFVKYADRRCALVALQYLNVGSSGQTGAQQGAASVLAARAARRAGVRAPRQQAMQSGALARHTHTHAQHT